MCSTTKLVYLLIPPMPPRPPNAPIMASRPRIYNIKETGKDLNYWLTDWLIGVLRQAGNIPVTKCQDKDSLSPDTWSLLLKMTITTKRQITNAFRISLHFFFWYGINICCSRVEQIVCRKLLQDRNKIFIFTYWR